LKSKRFRGKTVFAIKKTVGLGKEKSSDDPDQENPKSLSQAKEKKLPLQQ